MSTPTMPANAGTTTADRLPREAATGGRSSGNVILGISAVLASAVLTGCAPGGSVIDADYAQTCQDKATQQRVEDDKCSDQGRSSGHYGWYFLPMGSSGSADSRSIPAVGAPLTGGTDSIPSGATAKSGVSSKGSTGVSRGGFGGTAKGGSTGG
ncbi:tRNA-dihydrouridine synthase [Paenarthrobacter sp. YJN-5]|uniref:tRNA-dihydrouridine synthase n=1 Tax=Paenarthrobacter sp. YJN-5 TaxID=2735316 RepID=UPI001D0CD51C|nr:tRNA-dihydrouridine synthase [Paenarthrobacter sp. YJN-5]